MPTEVDAYREKPARIRVLFAMGVTQDFYRGDLKRIPLVMEACKEAFRDLSSRFDVDVLGTLDDDETMLGASETWPWTCYILADAPDRDAVTAVCHQVRETMVGDDERLWKYLKIEARLGRPLFFGAS